MTEGDGRDGRRFRRCGECGFFFDTRDPRGFVATAPQYAYLTPTCPACHQIANAAKAWAVWNSCNGIFTEAVFNTRLEAIPHKAEDDVVPVRVLREPEASEWYRNAEEAENERYIPAND